MTIAKNRDWIDEAYRTLDIKHAIKAMNLPDDTDIVLDCSCEGYYLTSWTKQCVFWLSDVDVDLVTGGSRPTLSETHLRKNQLFSLLP